MVKWDEIPLELAQKIGEHIYSDDDLTAFGRVCRWWRDAMKLAVASQARASLQTPWLMFAQLPPCPSNCRLYRLYHGTVQHLELPNLGGVCKYFSTCGWLVCLSSETQKIVLIDPSSRRIIQVPAFANYCHMWSKVTLLGNPLTTSDYTLAVTSGGKTRLWSSKDNVWIVEVDCYCFCPSLDITFFNGGLYSVNEQGQVIAYMRTNDRLTGRVVACLPRTSLPGPGSIYMVDLAGVLLVILRVVEGKDYMTVNFKVWKVNVKNGKVKEVNNLNNKAVFVGFNSSFFVEASPTYCKPNCIYYTDDIYFYCRSLTARGSDIGFYDLSCGMVTRDCFQGFLDFRCATPVLWVEKALSTSSSDS